jgi:hypothetical protein
MEIDFEGGLQMGEEHLNRFTSLICPTYWLVMDVFIIRQDVEIKDANQHECDEYCDTRPAGCTESGSSHRESHDN